MPIYAYRCDECGAEKDVLQKISDAPLTRCTQCGAEAFHKVLTAPAFQLKGSGWYVTDFRDGGNKSKPETTKPETASAGGDAAASAPKSGAPNPDAKAGSPVATGAGESKPSAAPAAGAAASTPGSAAPGGSVS